MIEYYKKRGETPLQALNRLRTERKDLENETLSYAGRLDPMAEGILPVLVGREENKSRKDFLSKDKEYEAHFLIGCSTDTGDVLGVIQESDFSEINTNTLLKAIESLVTIKEQTYPWYSSKTVHGIPLFEYARSGNFDIERPKRKIEIYSVSHIKIIKVNTEEIVVENIKDIEKVEGDFRQEEIIRGWNTLLLDSRLYRDDTLLVSCVLRVSSGTYIRGITEYITSIIGLPVVLERLIRTGVF